MRILLVGETYSLFGGGEIYLSRLVSLLQREGHSVKWWAPSALPFSNRDEILAAWNPHYAKALKSVITEFRPDVIHFHGFMHRLSSSVLWEARKTGLPVILTLHDFNLFCPQITLMREGPEICTHRFPSLECLTKCYGCSPVKNLFRFPRLRFNQYSVRKCVDTIIAPSNVLTKITAECLPNIPSHRLPNLLPKRSPDLPSIEGRTTNQFAYIGRLHHTKGIHFIINALANLRQNRKDVRLIICGSGPDEESLKKLSQDLHLADSVEFTGRLASEKILEVLKKSAALVVPSFWAENSPLVVYEALAANTPVIAANIGGLPDLVEDCETGYLFKPADIAELTAKMHNLLELHDKKRKRMAINIFERAKEFTHDKHCNKLIEIYSNGLSK